MRAEIGLVGNLVGGVDHEEEAVAAMGDHEVVADAARRVEEQPVALATRLQAQDIDRQEGFQGSRRIVDISGVGADDAVVESGPYKGLKFYEIGQQLFRSGDAKHVLVIGAETLTRIVDWNDRTTCVLFGDGAGAVVLKADEDTGILSTHLHADGSKKELLWHPVGVSTGLDKPGSLTMKGNDVFKYAVKALDSVVDETLQANGLDKSDLDWLIPHQANLRIIEATAKRLDMSMEQVVVTVDKHGNTSAGSVPLALDHAVRSGKVERGQLLLLEAFGGGFTWGSALLRY